MTRKRVNRRGNTIAVAECQGFDLRIGNSNPQCKGHLHPCEKQGKSFGTPFVTHAMLCDAHEQALGYKAVE